MAKITIYVPDEAPVKYGLDDEAEVTVGRAAENDIVIEHDSISSQHAKFVKIDDQFHLIDLGSTNGTFADGVEAANTPLHNGMRVIFGSVEVDYECDEFGGEEAAPVDEANEAFAGGDSGATGIHAEIGESSIRPPGFKDLSPVEILEKKDSLGQIAMVLGVVALLVTVALVVVSFTMQG